MTLLGKVFGESAKMWEECVHTFLEHQAIHIMDLVGSLTELTEGTTLGQNMVSILEDALALSLLLRHQRASWALRFPQGISRSLSHSAPVTLDPSHMKDLYGPDDEYDEEEGIADVQCHKQVDIFVTPGLYKQGNMDGEKYDGAPYVVLKAEVICAEVPPLPSVEASQQASEPFKISTAHTNPVK